MLRVSRGSLLWEALLQASLLHFTISTPPELMQMPRKCPLQRAERNHRVSENCKINRSTGSDEFPCLHIVLRIVYAI